MSTDLTDVLEVIDACPAFRSLGRVENSPSLAVVDISRVTGVPLECSRPTGFVYFVSAGTMVKIGYATNVPGRMACMSTDNPVELSLLLIVPADRVIEKDLHRIFRGHRERGEWFRLEGALLAALRDLMLLVHPCEFIGYEDVMQTDDEPKKRRRRIQ